LREKLVKIGAKVVRHSRYIVFRMAEKQLDGGEFEGTISCLKADCPLEDGQKRNPGFNNLTVPRRYPP